MKRSTQVLGLALATPLLLGALTGCGSSEEEKAAADSLAESFAVGGAEQSDGNKEFAQCAGESIVDNVGLDALREDGLLDEENQAVTPEEGATTELSEETAEGMASAILECNDWDTQAEELKANEDFAGSDEDIDSYIDCMKGIDEGDYEQMLVRQLSNQEHGDADAADAATEAVAECQQVLSEALTPEAPAEE